ncbi:integrase [Labrys miyagiensis]|uniref:Integrase n=1 Tax=Labrys miyagiensis TaxID=346912 RepID=A0ABQ6CAG7_9HYPH|nr:integrase family protein [Labrys miyagiensis]GLS17281.1 integrase [Labrys miyagiensis]
MPTVRLTKRTIESIPLTASGQTLYRDTELPGFGLRVGTRAKTFIAEGQLRRRTARVTIGRYPIISVEEARRRTLDALANMGRGVTPAQAKKSSEVRDITLAKAFETFFEAKTNLSPVSVDNYERTPRLYLAAWRRRPLREITRDMVLAQHRKISREHGAFSANAAMRHLRSVYNFIASLHEDLPPNPVQVLSRTRSWSPERRRRTMVAAHQLPAWWEAVQTETDDARDFLTIALFTGMRRNEIASLRWEDVDLIGQTLHLPRTKNGDPLILPLSGYLAGVIAARRERVGQSEWVFPGNGTTGHLVETKSFVARVVKAAGVPFSLHDMRRTFITIAESLDIPAYALKRLLNHRADGDVTGGYIVMSVDRLRGPVERAAERILEMASATAK